MADRHIVARAQQLLGTQFAEHSHGDHHWAGQRIRRPGAFFDHYVERPVAEIAQGNMAWFGRRSRFDGAALGNHLGKRDTVAVDVALPAGFDGT